MSYDPQKFPVTVYLVNDYLGDLGRSARVSELVEEFTFDGEDPRAVRTLVEGFLLELSDFHEVRIIEDEGDWLVQSRPLLDDDPCDCACHLPSHEPITGCCGCA